MSFNDNQGQKKYTLEELIARARARDKGSDQPNQSPEEKKEKARKGLEFMALRIDLFQIHLELSISKKITPAEDNLLKLIELGTIGARNSKSTICSKAEFFLDDLAEKLGVLKNKIYVNLKSLEKKEFIIRQKTRSKGREILGLNPKVFGQILVDQQHEREKRRHLRLVDNTSNGVDKSDPESGQEVLNEDSSSPETGPLESQIRTKEVPNQDQNDLEVPEITKENLSLDSSRSYLDVFRGQNRDQETHVSLGQRKG